MDLMPFMEQMGSNGIPIVASFFIGLMTAFSPCPLATNITAIAYISRRIDDSRHTMLVGLIYTLGRMASYAGLASLIVYVGLNTRDISMFLQAYGDRMLGPLLLSVGLVMLEVIRLNIGSGGNSLSKSMERLSERGYAGGFLLGALFALAFCPFSAVLYFGMLIPLALKTHDGLIIPSVFAVATGLPVIVSSMLLVNGVSSLGRMVNRAQTVEKTLRKIMGLSLVAAGIYYTLRLLV
jgi:cytochrome c-type biogenesis protein